MRLSDELYGDSHASVLVLAHLHSAKGTFAKLLKRPVLFDGLFEVALCAENLIEPIVSCFNAVEVNAPLLSGRCDEFERPLIALLTALHTLNAFKSVLEESLLRTLWALAHHLAIFDGDLVGLEQATARLDVAARVVRGQVLGKIRCRQLFHLLTLI